MRISIFISLAMVAFVQEGFYQYPYQYQQEVLAKGLPCQSMK
ncbi:MAG: hypothetical protein ACI8VI_001759 [Granulosicoccus sp.]|jgi:hypothetical protein